MKIYDIVLQLLKQRPELRSSDKLLQWRVFEYQGLIKNGYLSYENFMKALSFETIRRTRQKIQELHPELGATQSIKILRAEKQKSKGTWVFREETQSYYKQYENENSI